MLAYLKTVFANYTIDRATVFLHLLGGLDHEVVWVLTHSEGYKKFKVRDLTPHFMDSTPVKRLSQIYFWGGPEQKTFYRGTFLMFLMDKALLAASDQGRFHLEKVLTICAKWYNEPEIEIPF